MEREGWLFWLLQPTGSMCHLILLHTYKSASNCFLSTNISRIYGWKTATFFTIKTAELLIKLWKLSVKGGQWCFLKGFFFSLKFSADFYTDCLIITAPRRSGKQGKKRKTELQKRVIDVCQDRNSYKTIFLIYRAILYKWRKFEVIVTLSMWAPITKTTSRSRLLLWEVWKNSV